MRIIDMRSGTLACMTTVIIFSLFAPLRADGVEETEQSEQTLRLADLEEMALKNNPTLAQADASIREAQGRTACPHASQKASGRSLSQPSDGIYGRGARPPGDFQYQ